MTDGKEIKPSCEYFLYPGYIFLSPEPYLISTVVGSSVAVALWDTESRQGGMSNFLYPFVEGSEHGTALYGNVAIPYMIRMFLEEGPVKRTCDRRFLEAPRQRSSMRKRLLTET